MLLFEHKQYLQSCGAESFKCKRRYRLLKFWQFNAYKTTGKGLQRVTSRVWYSQTQITPAPGTRSKGARPCCAALEKRKRKLGMYVKIYSYESRFCLLTILMDSQVSKSLKQRFLILLLCRPALHLSLSLSLSLSLAFRSSDQLQQTVPIIHLFSHSNEKHYKWTRVRLLCCIEALIRIEPYIKS